MHQYVVSESVLPTQLKEKRKELNLTQKEFAELICVSKPTVERWESGEKPITGPVVLLLQMLTPKYLDNIQIPEKKLPIRMWYMYKEKPCTCIDVDENNQVVEIKNYVKNYQFRAFGIKEEVSYEEYMDFLKSRCFPETRDKMKLILEDLNLPFYDPYMIICKTEGRMAEDDFWIKVEK